MKTVPFLRIPPFPGSRAPALATPTPGSDVVCPPDLADVLRQARVGGAFWESANPWDASANARRVACEADSETALVAALLGKPLDLAGEGRFSALRDPAALDDVLRRTLCQGWVYRDPFTGAPIGIAEAIALLGRWRVLIEANRPIAAIHGVAGWKRITADALLWDGTGPVRHAGSRSARAAQADASVLAWRSRSDATALAKLTAQGVRIGEIEDGMIRSTGLGANCVPPLSIVVDAAGPHFDPSIESGLETLLQFAIIDRSLCDRAAALRVRLIEGGISKYGHDAAHLDSTPAQPGVRRVLVTGQVEDDRSVLTGGGGMGNLELLRRARMQEPGARIVFKPHPDVEAGHRKGHVPDADALEFADEIDRTSSIASLLHRVDAVHVLTSLAGFEALLRGLDVTTHGVPFFAGWGLTRDLGPVPARRTRRRSLDELVAATLILYPRYLDPVTRLPCEPEVLIGRIEAGEATVRSPLIHLREIQGRLNRLLQGRSRR
ncbi:putative capsule polysaccharide export protein [Novosphingobium sp. Rr 2-17]|uniref:capsular polysaccharide export protein, LipB/KpsS family n=1 Tax=Novosphingobium sp. Rr 2-17 TaxID=555793 RepID=UPI000269A216|nr:capsule polysaccharide export protein [Novosphingobium sp. Rr 2-17]EIZ78494.1 putative capsule polysaccharide export protein [Novosphingobium sp. Rr 2-17]